MLNPLAIGILLVLVCLTVLLPRRLAFCPIFFLIGFMSMGQQFIIAGLHFYLFRIILLTGMFRVIVRGELGEMKLTNMDKLFITWVIVSIVFGSLSKASMDLLVNRSGEAYNAIGCYFFARSVIINFKDVVTNLGALALMSLPIAALMLLEKITSHNPLFIFGGVSETVAMRAGDTAVRCQGAFRHSNLAGVYGGTQFPLFVALWAYRREYRLLSFSGMISAIIIVLCAHSSGGFIALLAGICGLALWRWRRHMHFIRWGAFFLILIFAIVMKAPVWYLIAKLSNVIGGGGWHRAYVIDQAVAHLDEWWLFGTSYTAHWGPGGEVIATDPNMMDITNHYIMEGVKGGFLKLGLFLAMIVSCFKIIGRKLRAVTLNSPDEFIVWMIGVALFTHCMAFMTTNYFDQTILVWYWLLASICCIGNFSSLMNPVGDFQFSGTTKIWQYSLLKTVPHSPNRFTGLRQQGSSLRRTRSVVINDDS